MKFLSSVDLKINKIRLIPSVVFVAELQILLVTSLLPVYIDSALERQNWLRNKSISSR